MWRMSKFRITCKSCGGKGNTELPDRLKRGYTVLLGFEATRITPWAKKLRTEVTAAHHLMKRLVKAGAAEQVKQRPAEYRAIR